MYDYSKLLNGYEDEINRSIMALRKVDFGSDEYNRIQDQIGYWQKQIDGLISLMQADEKIAQLTEDLRTQSKERLEIAKVQSEERIAVAKINSAADEERRKEARKNRLADWLKLGLEAGVRVGTTGMTCAHQTKLAMTGYEFEKTGLITSYTLKDVLKRH